MNLCYGVILMPLIVGIVLVLVLVLKGEVLVLVGEVIVLLLETSLIYDINAQLEGTGSRSAVE